MSNNTELVIPVAFATDTNYIVPTIVAVKSLIDHCSNSLNYILYLLTEEELNKRTLKIFRSLIKEKHNIKIVYLTVGKLIENVQLCTNGPTKGISKVTYYRFLLPELITGFDKVLYLDTDIIIRKDISSIFVTNIDEYYVAGVHDIVGYQIEEERCKELNINSLDSYVNAGVLLLNLKKIREDKKNIELLKVAKERSFPYNDQDIINSILFGHIKTLPYNCNVIVDYLKSQSFYEALRIDYHEVTNNPIIIHYAGKSKPWYSRKNLYADFWWSIVDSISSFSFYIEIIKFRRLIRKRFK